MREELKLITDQLNRSDLKSIASYCDFLIHGFRKENKSNNPSKESTNVVHIEEDKRKDNAFKEREKRGNIDNF